MFRKESSVADPPRLEGKSSPFSGSTLSPDALSFGGIARQANTTTQANSKVQAWPKRLPQTRPRGGSFFQNVTCGEPASRTHLRNAQIQTRSVKSHGCKLRLVLAPLVPAFPCIVHRRGPSEALSPLAAPEARYENRLPCHDVRALCQIPNHMNDADWYAGRFVGS